MKILIGILLVFLLLIASTNHKAIAQNISHMTGKGNYSGGGLSTKSVDIAKAHVTNLTSNMTGKGNYSGGGLSTKSVDIAKAHVTNLTSNMTGKGNYSGGGLSTKSVDIAKDKGEY